VIVAECRCERALGKRATLWMAVMWSIVLPLSGTAGAQVNLPPPQPDTGALFLAPEPDARPTVRQTLLLRGTNRRYGVDERSASDYRIAEAAGFASYQVRAGRWAGRLELAPLRYTATPAGSGATAVSGLAPSNARVEFRWRDGDTTRLYLRSGSSPALLDTAQSRALGAAGTNTLDLEAPAFGAQPTVGVRHATTVSLDGPWALAFRGAIETSPQPGGSDFVYWTGTTVRAGASLQRAIGASGRARVGGDISRSLAGDLGGRNLFPGGGSVTLDARASGLLDGDDGRWFGAAQAFYTSPFANPNADNLARLLPQGQFGGINMLVSGDFGRWQVGPTLAVLRESSDAESRFTLTNPLGGRPLPGASRKLGTGWSASGGLSATLGLTDALDLTVEGAVSAGGVDIREREEVRGPGGRVVRVNETRRENTIRGAWVAFEFGVRW
jgi:hypothetical protein